jgi:CdiI immunity protein
MRLIDKYSNLDAFFGRFHQDWRDEYGTYSGLVKAFLYGDCRESIEGAAKEMKEFLEEFQDVNELEKALKEFDIYPSARQVPGLREWLTEELLKPMEKYLAENEGENEATVKRLSSQLTRGS